ncbi:MAG: hypothetical protein WC794_04385 [Candidatus Doudnabacteria bacterium]|jgi:hypothetical protein
MNQLTFFKPNKFKVIVTVLGFVLFACFYFFDYFVWYHAPYIYIWLCKSLKWSIESFAYSLLELFSAVYKFDYNVSQPNWRLFTFFTLPLATVFTYGLSCIFYGAIQAIKNDWRNDWEKKKGMVYFAAGLTLTAVYISTKNVLGLPGIDLFSASVVTSIITVVIFLLFGLLTFPAIAVLFYIQNEYSRFVLINSGCVNFLYPCKGDIITQIIFLVASAAFIFFCVYWELRLLTIIVSNFKRIILWAKTRVIFFK